MGVRYENLTLTWLRQLSGKTILAPIWVTNDGTIAEYTDFNHHTTYQLEATDPQGLSLTYSLAPGSTLTGTGFSLSNSGLITGNLSYNNFSPIYITFTVIVSNGSLSSSREFTIEIYD